MENTCEDTLTGVGLGGKRSRKRGDVGAIRPLMMSEQLLHLSSWCILQASVSCVTSSRCEIG